MHLTTTNLVHYLIARGMIGPEAVVDGLLRIVEFGRRNANFKVVLGDDSGLFVKQMQGLKDPHGGLARELACHRLARSCPEYAPLLGLMPRLRDHDPGRHALAVELIHPGEDLRELHDRLGHLPEPVARALGAALGRFHALGPTFAARPDDLAAFPGSLPWILEEIDDRGTFSPEINDAQREILAALRTVPELAYGLDGLRRAWQPAALIHGDLKVDNIMARVGDDGGGPRVWFVDWELADRGDPAWDVAGLFVACLEPELHRAPVDLPMIGRPAALRPAFPALAALWGEYARAVGLPPSRQEAYRARCVHYLGARLILLAFDLLANRPEPTPITGLLLRMARSIMTDPARAGDHLLGFGPPSAPIS